MAGLPIQFRKSSSKFNATIPFDDIAAALGFQVYYGATQTDSDSTDYILTPNQIYSATRETRTVTAGTTTMNFDSSVFQIPRTAKGTAYVSFGIEVSTTSRWKFKVQKWDGATATDISTAQVISADYTGANAEYILFIEIPLTQTRIKKGEKLRLNVDMVLDGNDANGTTIGHDPQNRDGSEIIPSTNPASARTALTFYMPFKI